MVSEADEVKEDANGEGDGGGGGAGAARGSGGRWPSPRKSCPVLKGRFKLTHNLHREEGGERRGTERGAGGY